MIRCAQCRCPAVLRRDPWPDGQLVETDDGVYVWWCPLHPEAGLLGVHPGPDEAA